MSVVSASLNALEGLKRTAASVRSQTYPHVEHVVADGGSTDGTAEWLASQSEIRWISEPDSGMSQALNRAVTMATGDWVLVLQADDTFIGSRSLESAVPHLAPDLEVVSFDVLFDMSDRSRILKARGFSPRMEFKMTVPHQGAFCKRSLFDRIGLFDESLRLTMDYDWFVRAKRAGARIEAHPTSLTRMPMGGLSSRRDWSSLRIRFSEERRVHLRHCPSIGMRLTYAAYWPAYLAYRHARHLVGLTPR